MASLNQLFDKDKTKYGNTPSSPVTTPFGLRPLQILDEDDKDFEWYARNIDWLEWQGILQLHNRSKKFLKNYKLAAGILDKSDYIPSSDSGSDDSEYSSIYSTLLADYKEDSAIELKFYPLLPVIINVLSDEYSKRNIELTYKAIDEFSVNEILEKRKEAIEEVVKEWINRIVEEGVKQISENQNIDDAKMQQIYDELYKKTMEKFPNIEKYFNSQYKLSVERLCEKFHEYDVLRLNINEKMYNAFKDLLITGMFAMEFKMYDNDYDVVLWNPMFTFFKRNQNSPFFSDGEWIGKIELMSLNEIIGRYGKYIDKDIIEDMQARYGMSTAVNSNPPGYDESTGAYFNQGVDTPSSTSFSKTGGIDFERMIYWDYPYLNAEDIINKLFYASEDAKSVWYPDLFRVVTCYWKTLKKVGVVTKIDPITKEKMTFLVDSKYKSVLEPKYDTRFTKDKTSENLIEGEHIDWFIVPYVVGGIKIGPNVPLFYNNNDKQLPIYIGIDSPVPGPIKFQFNDMDNLFNCKLPVEGTIYTERNTQSMSLLDLGKPYQIAFNIVNNQIMDMLLDEIGSIILIDQNTIPKTSLEEDGTSNPLMSVYNYMRKYKMLPIDTSLANTGQPINFNQFQQMVIEHSPRIKTRIELAQYFQMRLFETIGLTPERMGRPTSEYQSGRASEINVVNSYSATEKYFKLMGDMFLPRFHEMRNSMLLWYLSNDKFKDRAITYITDKYEREIISNLNSEELLLRNFGVFPTNNVSYKLVIDQIKNILFSNPNLGLTITDAMAIMNTNKQSDIIALVKKLEDRIMEQKRQEFELEKMRKEEETNRRLKEIELAAKYQNEMLDKKLALERERIKARILETQIESARYMASIDLDKNTKSDYVDFLKEMVVDDYNTSSLYDKYIQMADNARYREKLLDLKNKELELKKQLKQMDYEIAKTYENKQ